MSDSDLFFRFYSNCGRVYGMRDLPINSEQLVL